MFFFFFFLFCDFYRSEICFLLISCWFLYDSPVIYVALFLLPFSYFSLFCLRKQESGALTEEILHVLSLLLSFPFPFSLLLILTTVCLNIKVPDSFFVLFNYIWPLFEIRKIVSIFVIILSVSLWWWSWSIWYLPSLLISTKNVLFSGQSGLVKFRLM